MSTYYAKSSDCPFPIHQSPEGKFEPGMSMRQYYKAAVASGFYGNAGCHEQGPAAFKVDAAMIGAIADALLAEDEQKRAEVQP